jgi:uncharacterized tellurite resistance protein B-like protein
MLTEIKELYKNASGLKETVNGNVPEDKIILAIAVLMLEMAGADNDFAPEEVKTCFRNLENLFGLTDTQALEILENAEKIRSDKEQVNNLVLALNENFTEDQRCLILALVWKVVIADTKIEKPEMRYANQLRVRLQLSEEQNEAARKIAFSGEI